MFKKKTGTWEKKGRGRSEGEGPRPPLQFEPRYQVPEKGLKREEGGKPKRGGKTVREGAML